MFSDAKIDEIFKPKVNKCEVCGSPEASLEIDPYQLEIHDTEETK